MTPGFSLVLCDARGVLKRRARVRNSLTLAALDRLARPLLLSADNITSRRAGLVDASGFGSFAITDTMLSHAGWTEFTGVNQRGSASAPSSDLVGAKVLTFSTITFTGAGTVSGMFFVVDGSATVGSTTGTLFATAPLIDGPLVGAVSDTLVLVYTLIEGTY